MSIKAVIGVALCLSVFFSVFQRYCFGEDTTSPKPVSSHNKIYYFQHRLLPKWTHESQGSFFDDLMHDRLDRLTKAAREVVGEEFSRKIKIRKYPESGGILLTFAAPVEAPECFFIYIQKKQSGFRFYTYEKALDLLGTGDKGVVGEWSIDGKHVNLGHRMYDDADSFVAELRETQ